MGPGAGGGEGQDCLMGTVVPFEMMKMFLNWKVVEQHCDYTKAPILHTSLENG